MGSSGISSSFSPPLIVTSEDVDLIVERLARALADLGDELR
jgi:acetylornithine/succinyldiaminopimelate/putrescine aminotransferase